MIFKASTVTDRLSISMLSMSFVVLFKVLEPRKHSKDDLSREKQVLALIHAIVV